MASETQFLLAEGKLNGWNMGAGTVQNYYEAGIDASMNQWGVTDGAAITSYKTGTTSPVALGDLYNTPALTNIPVAFAATEADQREQVALKNGWHCTHTAPKHGVSSEEQVTLNCTHG